MWWLLHGRRKTRAVSGGRTIEDICPSCKKPVKLDEVEIQTSGGVFFIDVLKSSTTAYRCRACGEVFEQREQQAAPLTAGPTGTPVPRPSAPRDLLAELEAEKAARAEAAQRRAVRIDDELAALKRKMGKD